MEKKSGYQNIPVINIKLSGKEIVIEDKDSKKELIKSKISKF